MLKTYLLSDSSIPRELSLMFLRFYAKNTSEEEALFLPCLCYVSSLTVISCEIKRVLDQLEAKVSLDST